LSRRVNKPSQSLVRFSNSSRYPAKTFSALRTVSGWAISTPANFKLSKGKRLPPDLKKERY